MTDLKREEVLHVAKLAKLDLSEEEIAKFTPQLSKVIDYISELSEVDTKGVEPTSQTTGLENVYRNDSTSNSLSLTQEQAINGTDKTHNGYFKVKAILEGRTNKS